MKKRTTRPKTCKRVALELARHRIPMVGFFIAQWFGGHFIFDSDAVSCRSWLASEEATPDNKVLQPSKITHRNIHHLWCFEPIRPKQPNPCTWQPMGRRSAVSWVQSWLLQQ